MAECCDNLRELFKKLKVTEELIQILQQQELLDEEDLAALTDVGIERLFPNSLGKQTKLKRLRDALQGPLSKDSEVTPVTVNTDKSRQPQLFQTAESQNVVGIHPTGVSSNKSRIAKALQSYPLTTSAEPNSDGHAYSAGNFKCLDPDSPLKIFQPRLKQTYTDKDNKIRLLAFGNMDPNAMTKNIMVVGETGTGKSTFIDCLFNCMLGVEFEDNVRLKLISLTEAEEKNKDEGQSKSQTEWITVYCIGVGAYHMVPYNMILVDTPGFGDTRGPERDKELNVQIRALFNNSPTWGVKEIHAICFAVMAGASRLTATQSYIFDSVLSVFGSDVAEVICLCCTNGDFTSTPNAITCCKGKIPFKEHFRFQNSAYFRHEIADGTDKEMLKSTWGCGQKSYMNLLDFLAKTKPVSLERTMEVAHEQEIFLKQIRLVEECMQETMTSVANNKRKKEEIMKAYADNSSKVKTYKVFKTTKERIPLNPGEQATNCQSCNATCCSPCIVNEGFKYFCYQMNWLGFCKSCDCWCGKHKKETCRIELKTTEVEEVIGMDTLAHKEDAIKKLDDETDKLEEKLLKELKKALKSQTRLREIALKNAVFTPEDYIDLLIESETKKGGDGSIERIKRYSELKRNESFMKKLIARPIKKGMLTKSESLQNDAYLSLSFPSIWPLM